MSASTQLADRTRAQPVNGIHANESAAANTHAQTSGPDMHNANHAPPTQTAGLSNAPNGGLSGLVCNVYRTTGREPRPLVGASTTVIGDKLYVFGGRKLSRTRPQLTADLYELDLVRRHWSKIETSGDVPPPRYFHSVCALGDIKLVCYGGMSPAILPNGQPTLPDQQTNPQDPQPEVVVMSDIHIYDILTRRWTKINTIDSPQGRYAHCASILPSSSVFASADAARTALHHNAPSPSAPNSGQLGVTVDGSGGAEMVVVGGQDSANHYIEQISVFNLRSLRWTSTTQLGRSCGAYRSVTAPISGSVAAKIGAGPDPTTVDDDSDATSEEVAGDGTASMLIYSNYNFLDVKLELQIRTADGSLIEKPMQPGVSPPGLRFPNGGVIDNHFVVSGTFLTTAKQEYALWALDLRTLTWFRIDAGGSTFTHGSWNRGVLWNRRNTFVVLGNRKRSLVEDYNHRRINFSNVCMVELEAFGLYDNPRLAMPHSSLRSASSPFRFASVPTVGAGSSTGLNMSKVAQDLGTMAMNLPELCDMDFLAMNGERIPANSRVIAKRWGPYFLHLLSESVASADPNADTATLRPGAAASGNSTFSPPNRNSNITITQSGNGTSTSSTLRDGSRPGTGSTAVGTDSATTSTTTLVSGTQGSPLRPNNSNGAVIALRPRTLYLPHTPPTIQALLHYLYTSSLPPPSSSLCTPQILCSLLQLARPYGIDGLLEAVVERLHKVLDNRNTAAIFNAAAMAAGGGEGVRFVNMALATVLGGASISFMNGDQNAPIELPASPVVMAPMTQNLSAALEERDGATITTGDLTAHSLTSQSSRTPLRIETQFPQRDRRPSTSTDHSLDSALTSDSELDDETDGDVSRSSEDSSRPGAGGARTRARMRDNGGPWEGGVSCVVGLQKRGLRGLMEGRRIREAVRGEGVGIGNGTNGGGGTTGGVDANRVGLGIA